MFLPSSYILPTFYFVYTKRTISDEIVRYKSLAIMKAILNYQL